MKADAVNSKTVKQRVVQNCDWRESFFMLAQGSSKNKELYETFFSSQVSGFFGLAGRVVMTEGSSNCKSA